MTNNQDGFSIIGIIMAFAIAAVVAYLYFGGNAEDMKANKALESRNEITVLSEALADEARSIAGDVSSEICLHERTLFSRPFGIGNSVSKLRLTKNLKGLKNFSADALPGLSERCSKPNLLGPSRIYFCLALDNPPDAHYPPTIIEISYDFLATGGGAVTTCQKFAESRTAVAEISYSIQMSDKAPKPNYIHKYGSAYVIGGAGSETL